MDIRCIIALIGNINEKSKQFISNELNKRDIYGLVSTHGSVLNLLYENKGKIQLKDISTSIKRSKSTVTDLIKKLIELGYVEKCDCGHDGRVAYAILTEKGYSIKPDFDAISDNLVDKCYQNFTDEELLTLIKLLQKLDKNIS